MNSSRAPVLPRSFRRRGGVDPLSAPHEARSYPHPWSSAGPRPMLSSELPRAAACARRCARRRGRGGGASRGRGRSSSRACGPRQGFAAGSAFAGATHARPGRQQESGRQGAHGQSSWRQPRPLPLARRMAERVRVLSIDGGGIRGSSGARAGGSRAPGAAAGLRALRPDRRDLHRRHLQPARSARPRRFRRSSSSASTSADRRSSIARSGSAFAARRASSTRSTTRPGSTARWSTSCPTSGSGGPPRADRSGLRHGRPGSLRLQEPQGARERGRRLPALGGRPGHGGGADLLRAAAGSVRTLLDGGVFAVNPAMCALAEVPAATRAPKPLLSLGTGERTRSRRFEEIEDWGLAGGRGRSSTWSSTAPRRRRLPGPPRAARGALLAPPGRADPRERRPRRRPGAQHPGVAAARGGADRRARAELDAVVAAVS